MARKNASLPTGTRLDSYIIEKTLGGGGFSIVYLGLDQSTHNEVAIKEYIPYKLCERDKSGRVVPADEADQDAFNKGMKLFINEASVLSKHKHPNIVNVVNFFKANGTVYMVMDYEAGANLQSYIKSKKGHLSEKLIRTIFPPLLKGLKMIHDNGLLHLDIKPGNIHIRPGGKPLLLDFGAAHSMQMSRKKQKGQVVTPGFSPIEQYEVGKGYVGPWTDIYALGATMRACIEGTSPPTAAERAKKDTMKPATEAYRKQYSEPLLQAIDWTMEMDQMLRPQKVDDLLEVLQQPVDPEFEPGSETVFDRLVNNLKRSR